MSLLSNTRAQFVQGKKQKTKKRRKKDVILWLFWGKVDQHAARITSQSAHSRGLLPWSYMANFLPVGQEPFEKS